MRRVVLAFLMVIAACGAGSNQNEATVGRAPTTIPLETAAPTTGRALASTTIPAAPSTSTEATEPDVEATVAPRPSGTSLEHVDVTASGVLAHGYSTKPDTGELARPMIWFSDDYATWVETQVVDLYQDLEPWAVPTVTDVAVFSGRYYAFLMGDQSTDATEPSMLVSTNGADWRRQALTAGHGLQLVAFTPESPPYPGASAVTDATIYDGQLIVTGWTRADEGTAPAVWISRDGATWEMKLLPNIAFPNEWGSRLSVGPLGYLVALGGPVHSGAGVLFSEDGVDWSPVDDVDGRAALSLAQSDNAAFVLRFDIFGTGKTDLLWTEDGHEWRVTPPVPEADDTLGSLGFTVLGEPVVFSHQSGAAWAYEGEQWVEWSIPQIGRLVDITPDHYIGTNGNDLVIVAKKK